MPKAFLSIVALEKRWIFGIKNFGLKSRVLNPGKISEEILNNKNLQIEDFQ